MNKIKSDEADYDGIFNQNSAACGIDENIDQNQYFVEVNLDKNYVFCRPVGQNKLIAYFGFNGNDSIL